MERHAGSSSRNESVTPLGLGRKALLLAMTETDAEEESYRRTLSLQGFRCVATEVGGSSEGDFQQKMARAVIGAALNSGLVEKEPRSVHALVHASEEAKRGLIVNVASSVNLAVKVAIVRNDKWVAVALFGSSSLHSLSCHERVGLGVMHLPD